MKDYTRSLNRRNFLNLTTSAALAYLYGCRSNSRTNSISDERNTWECEVPIDWIPDIAHPVSWGVQSFDWNHGAPRDLMIYYPSCNIKMPLEDRRRRTETDVRVITGVEASPLLRLKSFRYPVLLFLHGNMPILPTWGAAHKHFHRMYGRLASTLAKCGFVVVVPRHNAAIFQTPPLEYIDLAMQDLNWVRRHWTGADWIAQSPEFSIVGGHSRGAILAASIAEAHPEMGGYISIGGWHTEDMRNAVTLTKIQIPSFYMWAKNGQTENLDLLWSSITAPKYSAIYEGTHFDPLEPEDTGSLPRGVCPQIAPLTADLVTLFACRRTRLSWQTDIFIDLSKPNVQLTAEQAAYTGGHLSSFEHMNNTLGCKLDLTWKIGSSVGARHIGQL